MSQLSIYKASAGSGKTYRLVMEYLKLLVVNPFNYQHILAVTFTNKATSEMKERILRDLNKLATLTDQNLLQKLSEETALDETKIVEHAKMALSFILHDYDRFAVSTIDSFFQRVLRSFARESGLYGTYEIELDQLAVLEEACDKLLLSVDQDKELRKWLITMSEDQLGDGKNWRIDEKIQELGKELYNESFQQYLMNYESLEVERFKLKELKTEITKTQQWFENECIQLGIKGKELISKHGLELFDFKYKSTSFANTFYKLAVFKGGEIVLGARFKASLDNPEAWASVKEKQTQIDELYHDGLNELIRTIILFIEKHSTKYNTAVEIYKFIHALGVLTTLSSKVREIGFERNTLLLSEGNTLLRGIIGYNDAPFVYEKTGTYYHHFMIDEFQDTSVTQWENFKPLVLNSLSENHHNLVLGDVKQSIYRWRNSDWQLLNKQLKSDLAIFKTEEISLDANWRSSKNIVQFNNRFFETSKTILQQSFNDELNNLESPLLDEYRKTILDAYSDVSQVVKSNIDGGSVQCEFIEKDDYETQTLARIVAAVKEIQSKGYKARDIAILVKQNKEGKQIAEALLNQKKLNEGFNFEVISDDTLFIDTSATVRFIVNLIRYILVPSDQVIKATVVYEYANNLLPALKKIGKAPLRIAKQGQQTIGYDDPILNDFHFISHEVRTDFFPFFDQPEQRSIPQQWAHRNLIDLVEELTKRYHLDQLPGEQANLQAFKDVVNDFSKRESGNLHKFIEWWNQFGEKVKLQTAGQRDAIRIMTIHKSKGLEFPVVLLPFCDWSFPPDSKKLNILWCPTNNTPYQQFPVLPVKVTKGLQNSYFAESYYTEMMLSYIDNLNVLYVAQTRAIQGLYLFTKNEQKLPVQSVSHLFNMVFINDNQQKILPDIKSENIYTTGILTPKAETELSPNHEVNLSLKVKSQSNIGESLRLKRNYIDFLDETESERTIHINEGKLIHELFSFIETRSDVESAMQRMILEGKISADQTKELLYSVKVLMDNPLAIEWFDGSCKVLNETTIIQPGFNLLRPDRVMIQNGRVIIVDYKSTAIVNSNHQHQVQSYMKTIENMGYTQVDGYVWYLKSNRILNVKDHA